MSTPPNTPGPTADECRQRANAWREAEAERREAVKKVSRTWSKLAKAACDYATSIPPRYQEGDIVVFCPEAFRNKGRWAAGRIVKVDVEHRGRYWYLGDYTVEQLTKRDGAKSKIRRRAVECWEWEIARKLPDNDPMVIKHKVWNVTTRLEGAAVEEEEE